MASNQWWCELATDRYDPKRQLTALGTENQRLRDENNRLRCEVEHLSKLLGTETMAQGPSSNTAVVTNHANVAEKLATFRSLFKGREDVYAIRWEKPDGRAGYSPATRRRRQKGSMNDASVYLPLSDQVIYDHLAGKQTIGLFPLLRDETCWLLAADFDKLSWKDDALAFGQTCDQWLITAIRQIASFQNPDFYQKQAMRFSTCGIPRVICCADESEDHIGLPRGCFDELLGLLNHHSIQSDIQDDRSRGTPVDLTFMGTLSSDQTYVGD